PPSSLALPQLSVILLLTVRWKLHLATVESKSDHRCCYPRQHSNATELDCADPGSSAKESASEKRALLARRALLLRLLLHHPPLLPTPVASAHLDIIPYELTQLQRQHPHSKGDS